MASNGPQDPRNPSTPPQSIPLQDLARPPDHGDVDYEERSNARGRSLVSGTRPNSSVSYGTRYERLEDISPSPTERIFLQPSTGPPPRIQETIDEEIGSPIENPVEFQAAMGGFAGLEMRNSGARRPSKHATVEPDFTDPELTSPYAHDYQESSDTYFQHFDSDRIPLTDPNYLQPMSGAHIPSTPGQSHDRSSFQSVRFSTPDSKYRSSRLGDDLAGTSDVQNETTRPRGRSFGNSLSPGDQRTSRSNSTGESPLSRAGSIMRAMSQRVVNISNEPEPPELVFRRKASTGGDESPLDAHPSIHLATEDTFYPPERAPVPAEKVPSKISQQPPPPAIAPWPATTPFRGKSLGIFPPNSPVRIWLCDILIHPVTEIAILVLIILQTVLLAVESAPSVYDHPRSTRWGNSYIDYAILALFIIFTLEIVTHIIVSGFFFNAPEYSTIDQQKGVRAALVKKYHTVFGPQRQASVRKPRDADTNDFSTSFARSLTSIQTRRIEATSAEEFLRQQLARRAFLRHSLNRIDFIAVVSFWISFVLSIFGIEANRHLYVFRMMSCLRILRLLYLTNGTTIILKSLKKAAPLLVNVSFLIGFFWLLFAIIGVQAFKSSFDRQCLWIDPQNKSNIYNNNFTLCGGHLDLNGRPQPWVYDFDGSPGATYTKGYLCPRGSQCVQQIALYNGTVSFDNIANSLELVFVIMSANTFTDLMYLTTNSDYLPAALFFAAGIVIMMLWLTNLLIAVITSSFQVIREESKSSAFTAVDQPVVLLHHSENRSRTSFLKRWYDKTAWIWIVLIAYNIMCQTLRSASMPPERANFIFYSEIVVTFLLLFEMVIRFAGDWRNFHRKRRNLVDAAIAIITTVILLPPIRNSGQPYAWLSVFQVIRFYRVVWGVPMTRELIEKVLGNATGIGNLVLFIFLITFLVAIFAVQLFRGEITQTDVNNNNIKVTFSSIYNSFLGMYQILSSENWTAILFTLTGFNNYLNTGWIAAMFFIAWFILAYFILINMFIAVIQENFDVSEDEKRLQQVKAFLQRKEMGSPSSNLALFTIFQFGRSRKTKDPLDYGQAAMEMLLKDAVVRDFLDEEMDPHQQNATPDPLALGSSVDVDIGGSGLSALLDKFLTRVWHREPNPFYSSLQFSNPKEVLDPRAMAREAVSASMQRKKAQRDYLRRHPMYNNALFIFKPSNPIRRMCQLIVGPGRGSERFDGVEPNKVVWYTFSAFIYAAIVTMVVLACVTTPLYQKEYFEMHTYSLRNWFVWTDMAFAAIFTIEALIKVIADGFFWTPNAYFRSLWGFIDGLVLITLWINVATSLANDGVVARAVGAFKALRALRLLNVSDSARETFNSVILVGGWRVLSAAFVSLSLLIPFAIYGVNLFNGQMTLCNDQNISTLSNCGGEWNSTPFSNNWNVTAPRVAANPYFDFDNFGGALFILYQIVSQEGWIDVMWSATMITGRGLQPVIFASQGNAIFFVIFNLMATVFVLTLFISVFMRTYTEQTGVAYLTAEQRSWMEMRKLLRQVAPSKRSSDKSSPKWKDWCYKRAVQKHGRWHQTVTVILVLHLLLLMLEYYPEPYWWTRTRDLIFVVFTIFYIANTIIRIIGLTWPRFRHSSWDIYALFSVSGTVVTTILLFCKFESTTFIQLHNVFLVSITLLLIPRNNALDQLFKTAAASLTNIGNLLATWFVLFLVYAIAMTQVLGLTRFGSQGSNNLNLRTVPKALIVLFRMSCGEGWNTIMEDYATIQPPFCTEGATFFDTDCGSSAGSRVLFISWNILSMYIFVSLFVSLIYESFSYVYQRSSGLSIVTREETRRFKQAWAIFDPQGTGYITKENFPRLLGELSGVFAMRIYDEEDSVRRILEDVQVHTPGMRGNSVASTSQTIGIDLKALNERISRIDARKVRERRHRYNIFYQEVMVSADLDRGIAFTTVLMILAHYNVISDSKSLKLDEFLRRRARLQRVEEEVNRRVVVGFFDTLFWHRRFRRHIDRHKSARMVDIPQFEVPEIIVDDEDGGQSSKYLNADISSHHSATHMPDRNSAFREAFGLDGTFAYPESAVSSPARSPRLTPHRPTNSAFSFDLQEPGSPHHSRQGSGVSAENVLEVFSESAWGESLRRSFTQRRSRGGSS